MFHYKRLILFFFIAIFIQGQAWSKEVIAIGIAGGSGSGKTTLANALQSAAPNDTLVLSQDAYYKDLGHMSVSQRANVNFDHPESIDFELMAKDLAALKHGQSINMPIYDFSTHQRASDTQVIHPKSVIVVEGILVFCSAEIRELLDIKVYVDTDEQIRLARRIKRDQIERGRNLESILHQYKTTVAPMFEQFIQPSKQYANLHVSGEQDLNIALTKIHQSILKLKQKEMELLT